MVVVAHWLTPGRHWSSALLHVSATWRPIRARCPAFWRYRDSGDLPRASKHIADHARASLAARGRDAVDVDRPTTAVPDRPQDRPLGRPEWYSIRLRHAAFSVSFAGASAQGCELRG